MKKKINLSHYKSDELNSNYLSIGCHETKKHGPFIKNKCFYGGCVKIKPDNMYYFILTDPSAQLRCITERRTEFFMLFDDFDIDDLILIKYSIDPILFINFIIENILKALKYYIFISDDGHEIEYIYSDKEDDNGNFV